MRFLFLSLKSMYLFYRQRQCNAFGLIVKINAIRASYRENQCYTFCLGFPSNFTLDLLMAFIVKSNAFSMQYI